MNQHSPGSSAGTPRIAGHEPVLFFARGLGTGLNLKEIKTDERLFCGAIQRIVNATKAQLYDVEPATIQNLLLMADAGLATLLELELHIATSNGERYRLTRALLPRLFEIDLLPFVAKQIDGLHAEILDADDGSKTELEVTAGRLYGAFVLAQCYAATKYGADEGWFSTNGGFHAMQAAEAFGIAKLLANDGTTLASVVVEGHNSSRGRELALQRWKVDPTHEIKSGIRIEWERWQRDRSLYRYPRDFRRAMTLKFPEAVDGTIKNWMSAWGREKA